MPSPDLLPETPPARESGRFYCALQHCGRNAAWVRLSGELDRAAAPQLATHLDDALVSARLVVVDLRELSFMDSTGLGVVVAAHDRARQTQRRLVLVRGPAHVSRLLDLTGLSDRLAITDLEPV
jgi:anti-anti-sigma factor